MTCTSPKAPTMTLAGFRSRWMTPRLWAKPTAWQTCVNAWSSRGRSAVFSLVGQGLPGDEFHGQEGRAVGQRSQGVDRRDARVRQPGGDLRLADESVGVGPGQQDLESDVTVEAEVACGEDPAHAAAGDLAQHAVAGDRNRSRTSLRLGDHRLRARCCQARDSCLPDRTCALTALFPSLGRAHAWHPGRRETNRKRRLRQIPCPSPLCSDHDRDRDRRGRSGTSAA